MSGKDHVSRRSGLLDGLRFLGKFLRSPGKVGSIMPSSRHLAEVMTDRLDLKSGDLVVEYGPGTGPMTAVLSGILPDQVRYLGIERDARFQRLLKERFQDLDFHLGSVADIQVILRDRGLGKAKAIVSGLPFASLPRTVQLDIVAGTRAVLADDGEFRTFQYVHMYRLPAARHFRQAMAQVFGSFTRSPPVLRNVPPAYVLSYRP